MIDLLSFVTIGFGTPAGAAIPFQLDTSKSGTPLSITVGTSFRNDSR